MNLIYSSFCRQPSRTELVRVCLRRSVSAWTWRFQSDHPDHDGWSGYNVTGNIGAGAHSELMSRLWCARLTARCCKSHLRTLAWHRSLLRLVGNNAGISWNFSSGCCLFFFSQGGEQGWERERDPFWANVSIGGGFCRPAEASDLSRHSPKYRLRHGEWRGFLCFSYFPSFPVNGVERRGWHLRIHSNKNMRKPESTKMSQRGRAFGSGSALFAGLCAPRWHRGCFSV